MTKLIESIIVLQLFIFYGCYSMPSSQVSVHSMRHREKTKLQVNICDLVQLPEAPVYCHCNEIELGKATVANCVVITKLGANDTIWNDFTSSQSTIERLSLTVRYGGNMTQVPSKTIQQLSHLKRVKIQHGNLESLHEKAFADLANITEINVEKSKIVHLRKNSFFNMSKLIVLNLDDNYIVEINREVFVNLPALKKLFINRNNITLLHDRALKHLTSLEELELNDNKITVITTDTFNGLKALTRLVLRNNEITMIGDRTFVEMPELRQLELDGNRIKYIAVNAFEGMGKLKKLSISDNRLVRLEADVFAGAPAINFLDLRNNSLVTMTFDNVKPIVTNLYSNSSYLYLDDNKFICDCKLAWIKGVRNETVNNDLKNSLDLLTCFLESRNRSLLEGENAATSATIAMNVNKSDGKMREQDTNNFMADSTDEEDEELETYEDYPDQPSKADETGKLQAIDGKLGYMKHLFELKLEELPCPEQSRDASEQPSSRRENAAVASVASAQHAATIGQCLLLLLGSLLL